MFEKKSFTKSRVKHRYSIKPFDNLFSFPHPCSINIGIFAGICTPAHRYRLCSNHCLQVLVCRLLLFLTSFKGFRKNLNSNLKNLIQLLDPTLDPQVLCLLLQTLALVAQDPSTHRLFYESQIEDSLIQMLLPAGWFFCMGFESGSEKFCFCAVFVVCFEQPKPIKSCTVEIINYHSCFKRKFV